MGLRLPKSDCDVVAYLIPLSPALVCSSISPTLPRHMGVRVPVPLLTRPHTTTGRMTSHTYLPVAPEEQDASRRASNEEPSEDITSILEVRVLW